MALRHFHGVPESHSEVTGANDIWLHFRTRLCVAVSASTFMSLPPARAVRLNWVCFPLVLCDAPSGLDGRTNEGTNEGTNANGECDLITLVSRCRCEWYQGWGIRSESRVGTVSSVQDSVIRIDFLATLRK